MEVLGDFPVAFLSSLEMFPIKLIGLSPCFIEDAIFVCSLGVVASISYFDTSLVNTKMLTPNGQDISITGYS